MTVPSEQLFPPFFNAPQALSHSSFLRVFSVYQALIITRLFLLTPSDQTWLSVVCVRSLVNFNQHLTTGVPRSDFISLRGEQVVTERSSLSAV